MGGTWVTHHMGYLFREMVRYHMDRDLITTGSPDMHKGYYSINTVGKMPFQMDLNVCILTVLCNNRSQSTQT